MSESEENSPTRGPPIQSSHHDFSNAEYDANNSIIGKVRSRVSSTFSKWFSPSASTNEGSDAHNNGSLRRRRNESDDRERNSDDSDDSECDDQAPISLGPPAKRSRLNVHESITSFKTSETLRSSTPLTAARSRLGASDQLYADAIRSRLQRCGEMPNQTTFNIDVKKRNSAHQDVGSTSISSRKSLNIPSTSGLNRENASFSFIPRTSTTIGHVDAEGEAIDLENDDDEETAQQPTSSRNTSMQIQNRKRKIAEEENVEEQEEDEGDEEDDVVSDEIQAIGQRKYTNGLGRGSQVIVSVDSASESGESRSSSVINQSANNKSGLFRSSITGNNLRSSMSNGLNFYSHLEGRKSLFSDKNMSNILKNSTLSLTSLNRRQFNSSIYGSTSALSDSRLLNTYSPFYKGPTTFGGAAAYSKYSRNLQQHSMRITPTLIRPTSSLSTLTSSNNSLNQIGGTNQAISSTAKRILELINDFPTPLSDAKKMANNIKTPTLAADRRRYSDIDLASSRSIRLSTVRTPYSRPNSKLNESSSGRQLAPPIRELQVPSMSQLLQMKKLQSGTERARQIANTSKSVLNRKEEYKLPTEATTNNNVISSNNSNNCINNNNSSKYISKIKNVREITSTRISNKTKLPDDAELLPAVNLPDIQLPFMESVPKIDIALKMPAVGVASSSKSHQNDLSCRNSSKPKSSVESAFVVKNGPAEAKITNKLSSTSSSSTFACVNNNNNNNNSKISSEFKFSSPIEVANSGESSLPINNFKFSPPVPVDTTNHNLDNMKHKSDVGSVKKSSPIKSLAPVTSSSTTCGPQLKTGSVLDALKKPAATTTTTKITNNSPPIVPLSDPFKIPASKSNKWECDACMIQNDEKFEKCEACTTPRPKKKEAALAPLTGASKSNFGEAFKTASDTWECPTCMIRNKVDLMKCLACETKKPGSAATPAATVSVPKLTGNLPIDAGFKSIVSQQAAKWECPACMTRNDSTRSKCVCCEQAKPGSSTAASVDAPKFSFGASAAAASKFKFGFAAAEKEADLKKLDGSKTEAKKDATETKGFTFGAVATSAPSTLPAIGFSFGIKPAAVSSGPSGSGKDVTDTKPTFSFGAKTAETAVSSASTTATTSGFKMPTTPVNEKKSTTDATNTASPGSIFKPIGSLAFGSPSSSAAEKKPEAGSTVKPSFAFGNPTTAANTETKPSFGFQVATTSSSTASETKSLSGFSFGASEPKKDTTLSSSAFKAPAQKTETSSATSGFVFGQQSTPSLSATSVFGASTSASLTKAPEKSSTGFVAPGFGSFSASTSSAATVAPSFGSPRPVSSTVASSSTTSTFSASNTFGSPQTNSTAAAPASNLFAFGAPAGLKREAPQETPAFGSTSASGSTPNKTFAFGSANKPENSSATNGAPFAFNATAGHKPVETTSTNLFGAAIGSTGSGFGATAFTAPATNAPQQSAFGQPAPSATNPSPFGATATPIFGSTPGPAAIGGMFGSSSTPSFGSSSFGSSNTVATFGSTAAAAPSFGSGGFGSLAAASSDGGPAAKKSDAAFNFGGPAQPASSAGFSFGSNNNNNNQPKAAFNFTASSAPSFNFTGSSTTETTPNAPFQFNANNNIFAPMPTPGASPATQQPQRRKMRQVTRRITPR